MVEVHVARMVDYTDTFAGINMPARMYVYSYRYVTTRPKPCPFCNNDDVCVVTDGQEEPTAWVVCANCEANGPHVAIPINKSLYDSAIDAWNER